jgi:hypothetical protein
MSQPAHVVFAAIMERARRTNRERDRQAGCAVPRDGGARTYLAAAMSATECGLLVEDRDAVAEGLAMLEDLQETYLPRCAKDKLRKGRSA